MRVQKLATNKAKSVIGVDVGGTKIASGVVNADGEIVSRDTRPTDISSPAATLDGIGASIGQALRTANLAAHHIEGVGLGIPGLIDPIRGVGIASVNLNWENVPVAAEISQRVDLPCFIENDVRAAGMGEAVFGDYRDSESMIYMSIGTGIAAAIIREKKILRGTHGLAGEIGHAVVERDGLPCKCGARGCLEAMAAGPAISTHAENAIRAGEKSALADLLAADGALSAEAVVRAAEAGDQLALKVIDRVGGYLAFALQALLLAHDPDRVILSGGVINASPLIMTAIHKHLARQAAESWVLGRIYSPEMLQLSSLEQDTAILGAAALVLPDGED